MPDQVVLQEERLSQQGRGGRVSGVPGRGRVSDRRRGDAGRAGRNRRRGRGAQDESHRLRRDDRAGAGADRRVARARARDALRTGVSGRAAARARRCAGQRGLQGRPDRGQGQIAGRPRCRLEGGRLGRVPRRPRLPDDRRPQGAARPHGDAVADDARQVGRGDGRQPDLVLPAEGPRPRRLLSRCRDRVHRRREDRRGDPRLGPAQALGRAVPHRESVGRRRGERGRVRGLGDQRTA